MKAKKIEVTLTLLRSTPGTHVLANEEEGYKGFYFGKDQMKDAGMIPAPGKKYKLTLEEV